MKDPHLSDVIDKIREIADFVDIGGAATSFATHSDGSVTRIRISHFSKDEFDELARAAIERAEVESRGQ